MNPQEIIARPLELWVAPAGESFPAVGAAPVGNWVLLGKSGDKSYTEDGVTIQLAQTIEEWTPAGSTMAVKAFRTNEQVLIGVTIADITAENLKVALNGNTVTSALDESELSLIQGMDVEEYALLARGMSPYDNAKAGQFQVPRCYQAAEPEVTFQKGEPAAVELSFASLDPGKDDEDDFVVIYEEAS